MRPLFADPKTDYVFKRIFGSATHEPVLIGFLNAVLELDERHRIVEVELLSPEQRPAVSELKHSIVDVKCRDQRGVTYVVEMQVLNVEGFEKRIVYNVAKAYTMQLGVGENYPMLNDVVGVTVCNFALWPDTPMLSRWRMQEQHSGLTGLPELQFVFLELPKYTAGDAPQSIVDKWAYFFRAAPSFRVVPAVLDEPPFRDALEGARTGTFTEEEWDDYIRARMALQDGRGALSLARREGRDEGHREGLTEGRKGGLLDAIDALCDVFGIALPAAEQAALRTSDVARLETVFAELRATRRWPGV